MTPPLAGTELISLRERFLQKFKINHFALAMDRPASTSPSGAAPDRIRSSMRKCSKSSATSWSFFFHPSLPQPTVVMHAKLGSSVQSRCFPARSADRRLTALPNCWAKLRARRDGKRLRETSCGVECRLPVRKRNKLEHGVGMVFARRNIKSKGLACR